MPNKKPISDKILADLINSLQSLTNVQRAIYNDLNGNISQILRFQNEYQVIAYIATRDVELSLRFDSIGSIVQYYAENPQGLYAAVVNLTIRVTGNEVISRYNQNFRYFIYTDLLADLHFCLNSLLKLNTNSVYSSNDASTDAFSHPDIDPDSTVLRSIL